MKNTLTTESRGLIAFASKLETVPGGRTIAVADLVQATLLAGTPVGKDANGLGHVVKVAEVQAEAADDATTIRIKKNHDLKVGNHICSAEGAKAQTITAIDTTNATYDTVSIGTTLGVVIAANAHIYEAAAATQGTDSALKYTPDGLVGEDITLQVGGSNLASVVVRGSAYNSNIPPVGAVVKAKLPLIRFV